MTSSETPIDPEETIDTILSLGPAVFIREIHVIDGYHQFRNYILLTRYNIKIQLRSPIKSHSQALALIQDLVNERRDSQ